jgi:hypothetical protein
MTRIEEINNAMLSEFKTHQIEDTIENRIVFLTGLQDGWNEDTDVLDFDQQAEKSLYQMALSAEIFGLQLKKMFTLFPE